MPWQQKKKKELVEKDLWKYFKSYQTPEFFYTIRAHKPYVAFNLCSYWISEIFKQIFTPSKAFYSSGFYKLGEGIPHVEKLWKYKR